MASIVNFEQVNAGWGSFRMQTRTDDQSLTY